MRFSPLLFVLTFATAAGAAIVSPDPAQVHVGGYLGQRLDGCLEHNVKATDAQVLAAVFQRRDQTDTWQTEFWGKWMHSAVPLARYSGDVSLRAKIDRSVATVRATQRADGYIGNYTDAAQLDGPWDIWGRKYTMLGLLLDYDLTGDKAVLTAAERVADHLMTQVGPGRRDLYEIGMYHGMASCSVLEPIVQLYQRTHDPRYLAFARYIVSQLEEPADGPRLITQALAGVDVGSRFPHPKVWWSWENGQKAYEMMSCYQGLLEFYEATGDRRGLDAGIAVARNIIATEINAAGSGAAFECWYHGAARETEPAYHMMETCVTTTWLRLCETLLRLTGDPAYADQIERTLYNAYLAALSADNTTFSKYCPLEGTRGRGEDQCGLHTNCCIANGPRGFVTLLDTLVMADTDAVLVNLYAESRATITLRAGGNRVTVTQHTDYPVGDVITLTVDPAHAVEFAVKLRIPGWSAHSTVAVNGGPARVVPPGAYYPLVRTWQPGDTITLHLDLRGRARLKNNHLVIERGPIVLTRDARLSRDNIHDVVHAPDLRQPVPLTAVRSPVSGVWMAFATDLGVGLNLEAPAAQNTRRIVLCDFASAGNTWSDASRYRVWQRLPLNVMQAPYVPYNR